MADGPQEHLWGYVTPRHTETSSGQSSRELPGAASYIEDPVPSLGIPADSSRKADHTPDQWSALRVLRPPACRLGIEETQDFPGLVNRVFAS